MPFVLTQLQRADDVGVMDLRGELRLFEEHLLHPGVVDDVGQDGLDRDQLLKAARAPQPRRPDLRHAALGDRQQELVAAQDRTGAKVWGGLRG